MIINYQLNKNIISKTAAYFTFDLNNFHSDIHIKKNNSNKIINAKSLIEVLKGNLKNGDNIKVYINDLLETDKIKKCFINIGREIN